MSSENDHYRTLEVPEDADGDTIKKAYRKLALKYHPDKQKAGSDPDTASSMFTMVSNAYEVLSDPEKRRQYDIRTGKCKSTASPRSW